MITNSTMKSGAFLIYNQDIPNVTYENVRINGLTYEDSQTVYSSYLFSFAKVYLNGLDNSFIKNVTIVNS